MRDPAEMWTLDRPPACAGGVTYEAELAIKVMDYLSRHPQAMDTARGIAEWWIPARANSAVMRRVLDKLVCQGFLEQVGSGERAHYRLKKQALDS